LATDVSFLLSVDVILIDTALINVGARRSLGYMLAAPMGVALAQDNVLGNLHPQLAHKE
jgi:hypothetical protein